MELAELERWLDVLAGKTVGVAGDFCVDAYWTLDPDCDERSVETGKRVNRVMAHKYALGGAGNVVSNLAAIGVARVKAFGMLGQDVFGQELSRQLEALGVDTSGMLVQKVGWNTTVYAKPYRGDEEDGRFDFGTANVMAPESETALLERLAAAMGSLDALIINQQLPGGYHSAAVVAGINRLVAEKPALPVLVDSRHKSHMFAGAMLKLNAFEAAAFCGESAEEGDTAPLETLRRHGERIAAATGKPLVITRGARGMAVFAGGAVTEIPGIQILRPVDPVGAGDTACSALAAMLAAGASLAEAAFVANLATSVTVQKIKQTGTASRAEILAVGPEPDFVFRPELAEDPRRAVYLEGSEIELVDGKPPAGHIAHAVFDHDGTISTLREGWDQIMERVMVRCILGDAHDTVGEAVFRRVTEQVRTYIDKSAGLQTIVQMEALAELVREFGFVPAEQVHDAAGYKAIYNTALMERIECRTARVQAGEFGTEDWTLKGAVEFLRTLRARGVRLYLASGTDEEDVVAEARILGYAELFEGRIYGARGNVAACSKKEVIAGIIREHGLKGPELAAFGDGPVELREAKKRGGIAVGIASDEVRRFGLNPEKRTRLIRAGADIIVPDYAQGKRLLHLLFGVDRNAIRQPNEESKRYN